MTFAEAGFVIDLQDHVTGDVQTGQISAVRANEPEEACVTETRDGSFWASCQDPGNGTLSPAITGDGNTPTPLSTRAGASYAERERP